MLKTYAIYFRRIGSPAEPLKEPIGDWRPIECSFSREVIEMNLQRIWRAWSHDPKSCPYEYLLAEFSKDRDEGPVRSPQYNSQPTYGPTGSNWVDEAKGANGPSETTSDGGPKLRTAFKIYRAPEPLPLGAKVRVITNDGLPVTLRPVLSVIDSKYRGEVGIIGIVNFGGHYLIIDGESAGGYASAVELLEYPLEVANTDGEQKQEYCLCGSKAVTRAGLCESCFLG